MGDSFPLTGIYSGFKQIRDSPATRATAHKRFEQAPRPYDKRPPKITQPFKNHYFNFITGNRWKPAGPKTGGWFTGIRKQRSTSLACSARPLSGRWG